MSKTITETIGGDLQLRGGQIDDAILAYREAIRLDPKHAKAHVGLGLALRREGRFAEALDALRRGHELGSRDPHWAAPSAKWVKECEHLVQLDEKLPRVLRGEVSPTDARERLVLARCEAWR